MPRNSAGGSLDEVVRSAIQPAASRVSQVIARAVARLVADQLEAELAKSVGQRGGRGRGLSKARARGEMTRWVADKRARRVPNFVIDLTGLKTKKQIVAKFGEATFEKGKPLPKVVEAGASTETKSAVKAKPPVVRKKAKAAA